MRQRLVVLSIVCLLVAAVAPAMAIHNADEELVVSLEADGDATVTRITRYNLTNATEQRTFERLKSNETLRQQRAEAFREYLEEGAALAEERTGREMTISEVAVNLTRTNETGTLRLRATWKNLARVDGPRVVVTEPFASGYPVNATLTVEGPDGYVREFTRPGPGRALGNSAAWGENRNLTGFVAGFINPEAVATTEAEPSSPPVAPVTGPDLTVLFGAASLALIPALLFLIGVGREER